MNASLDIFISYRRGGIDQPNAGRIHDYLQSLGYHSYYDKDEIANPTGRQFPDTIVGSLDPSKVIIAVIGESWMAQIHHLADETDWVRRELLYASPQTSRHFIPIYISTDPGQLADKLPSALAFIKTTNSQFIWPGFENQQKEALKAKLQELLPDLETDGTASDSPRLELLCDRNREVDRFDHALHRRPDTQRPGGWLLFGENDQGQHAIFDRITDFTLRNNPYKQRYPVRKAIKLDLHEFYGCSEDEMRLHVFGRATEALKETEVNSFAQLYEKLAKRKVSLAMFFSVVYVTSSAQAQWWISRFDQLHAELPALEPDGVQLIFVLSIAYAEQKRGLLSLFKRPQQVGEFFEQFYPEHFASDEEYAQALRTPRLIATSRLKSARESDVRIWCENRYVKTRISGIPKESFLQQFKHAAELPMDNVIDHLSDVLRRHGESNSRGVAPHEHLLQRQ